MNARLLLAPVLLLPFCSGCHSNVQLPTPAREAAAAQRSQAMEDLRQQLDLVPPPSKTRYMNIHSLDSWENPFLTIQPDMVTLHVLVADANPTAYGSGGLMRPIGARRQDLNVSLDKLAEALAAIPRSAWPYGRVVAVEEAHKTPKLGEPQVRRTMESAMRTLSDLGIVTDEWNETGPK